MQRLFVALTLSDEVCTALADLQGKLRGFRWVPPDNYHLTLQFLGEVDDNQFLLISEALDRVSMDTISLQLQGLGSFGPGQSPRVLWVGVEQTAQLSSLYHSVRSNLRKIVKLEHRKFRPHVTLARGRNTDAEQLHQFLEERNQTLSLQCESSCFHLFSSSLHPTGAVYTIETSYPADSY